MIPAFGLPGMIPFPASFKQDSVKVYARPTGTDNDAAAKLQSPDSPTVTIACQVSLTRTLAPVIAHYGDIAPHGEVIYDVMFGHAEFQALVDGGVIETVNGEHVVIGEKVEWLSNRYETFAVPRLFQPRGPIDMAKGHGSRYTLTASLMG